MVQLLTPLPAPWEASVCSSRTPQSQGTRRERKFGPIKQNLGAGVVLETAGGGNRCVVPEPLTWPEVKHRVDVTGVLQFMGPFKMKKRACHFKGRKYCPEARIS